MDAFGDFSRNIPGISSEIHSKITSETHLRNSSEINSEICLEIALEMIYPEIHLWFRVWISLGISLRNFFWIYWELRLGIRIFQKLLPEFLQIFVHKFVTRFLLGCPGLFQGYHNWFPPVFLNSLWWDYLKKSPKFSRKSIGDSSRELPYSFRDSSQNLFIHSSEIPSRILDWFFLECLHWFLPAIH